VPVKRTTTQHLLRQYNLWREMLREVSPRSLAQECASESSSVLPLSLSDCHRLERSNLIFDHSYTGTTEGGETRPTPVKSGTSVAAARANDANTIRIQIRLSLTVTPSHWLFFVGFVKIRLDCVATGRPPILSIVSISISSSAVWNVAPDRRSL
jgi:hypothetical protein